MWVGMRKDNQQGRFGGLSIRARLIGLVSLCAVVAMLLGGMSWMRQREDSAVMASLERTTQVTRAAMLTDMMHDAIHAEVVGAALAVALHDQAAYEEAGKSMKGNVQVLMDSFAQAQARAPTAQAREALAKARPSVERYRDEALATYARLQGAASPREALAPFEKAFDETEEILGQAGDIIEQSATDTTTAANASMATGRNIILGSMLLGLALIAVLTPPIVVSVLRPIQRMLAAVSTLNTDDGDLSHRLPPLNAEFKQLSDEFNLFLDKITAVVAEVHLSASTIGSASDEIATGNLDLSKRTEGAAQDLQMTATNVDQLTSAVNQTVSVASQAKDLASGASDVAGRGNKVMSSMVRTMEDINHASRKIGDIIGVIDGIAFQTNILALNAAVEAARAGEQGRGFAVVASEVRALAQRSAGAAREIKGLIGSSVEQVDSGFRLVKDAGDTMLDIVASVRKVNELIEEITVAAAEQQSGFHAINQAVLALDRKTQENAALVQQQAAAAESLRHQTVQLNGSIEGFKLHTHG